MKKKLRSCNWIQNIKPVTRTKLAKVDFRPQLTGGKTQPKLFGLVWVCFGHLVI